MKVYSHGLQGWIKSDTVGVYVLSGGFPQENVMYVPSQTAKPTDNRGFIMYDKRNPVSKDILLTPVKEGKEICFKEVSTKFLLIPLQAKSPRIIKMSLYQTSQFRSQAQKNLLLYVNMVSIIPQQL